VRLEVFTVIKIQVTFFWVVRLYSNMAIWSSKMLVSYHFTVWCIMNQIFILQVFMKTTFSIDHQYQVLLKYIQ